MNKINTLRGIKGKLLIVGLILTVIGCQKKPIPKCNLLTENGITYTDGRKYTGTCNIFYSDSILMTTVTYKRGYINKSVGYHLGTQQIEYIGYRKDGMIDGEFISYYENGVTSIEGQLDMGQPYGEWTYYDSDNSVNKKVIYENGKVIDSTYYKLSDVPIIIEPSE
tara:strand:- start:793 stop:1290 length:498 start_codon:yes stop_codon:yes gene_type:complete